jgi:hypothetical protein
MSKKQKHLDRTTEKHSAVLLPQRGGEFYVPQIYVSALIIKLELRVLKTRFKEQKHRLKL